MDRNVNPVLTEQEHGRVLIIVYLVPTVNFQVGGLSLKGPPSQCTTLLHNPIEKFLGSAVLQVCSIIYLTSAAALVLR